MTLEFEDGSSVLANVVVDQVSVNYPCRDFAYTEFQIRAYEVACGPVAVKGPKGKAGELIRCIRMKGMQKE